MLGPKRAVAWRVLDAQYFGVAQRRRRVFVVASARNGFDPAAVLFEFDGLRRDTTPSREAGKIAPTIPSRSTAGGGLGTDFDLDGGVIQATTHTLRGEGFDTSEDGTGRGTPLVPCVVGAMSASGGTQKKHGFGWGQQDWENGYCVPVAYGIRTANTSSNGWGVQEECTHTLDCAQGVAVAFQERGRTNGPSLEIGGDVAYALTAPNGGGRAQERNVLTPAMQVRRLTPTEAERLQGFPDDYTLIPWRGKPADQCPDGPRYRALGNSWAVPNVRWIGQRIQAHLDGAL